MGKSCGAVRPGADRLSYSSGDKLINASEGERLARAASGATELVVFEEGNHVCFNISYKFRPLTADWMADRLLGEAAGRQGRAVA